MTKDEIMDRLKSEWSSEYALQPTNEASRKVIIEIQALKKEAAKEIESLRQQLAEAQAVIKSIIDSLDGSYENHAIRKRLQEALDA